MYIIAIAWIYVVFMMAITESSVVAGIMTFVLYGVLPVGIIVYVMGTGQRKRKRQARHRQHLEALQENATPIASESQPVAEDQSKRND